MQLCRHSAVLLVVAVAALLPAHFGGAASPNLRNDRDLRPMDDSMVKPFRFDQQLIVCNAYPSLSAMTITKNGREMLANESRPLHFRECRKVQSRVQPHDKLDLLLTDLEIHGTFEVGALPASDAVLLLVLQKRDKSRLVSFQSFAFPAGSDSRTAQLAVIDAYKGNSSTAHLRMEDHLTGKEEHAVSKRVEQLTFNRVYSVEEGDYDASVTDQKARKLLKLTKHQNYVILRTGEEGRFPESLVLYPPAPLQGGAPLGTSYVTPFLLLALVRCTASS